jgi:hypothetical protein
MSRSKLNDIDKWIRKQARRRGISVAQFMRGAMLLRAASEAPNLVRQQAPKKKRQP